MAQAHGGEGVVFRALVLVYLRVCVSNFMCICIPLCLSDVDDIHDMMDDIQEQNEIAEEISGALSQPIGFASEIDDVSTCTFLFLHCSLKFTFTRHLP